MMLRNIKNISDMYAVDIELKIDAMHDKITSVDREPG